MPVEQRVNRISPISQGWYLLHSRHPERSEGPAFLCTLNNFRVIRSSRSFATLRMMPCMNGP